MATHILVVDDEATIRHLLARVLGAEGFRVTEAASAPAAIDRAVVDPPDLVIADVSMPGESGLDLCRKLPGALGAAVPVMLLSGLADEADFLAGFDAGAVDYLPKPWKEAELLAKVRRHLAARAPAGLAAAAGLGTVGQGRVRLEAALGHGGMGSVYRGMDLRLGRPVAVKLLRPDLGRDQEFVVRFLQEARILGQLDLPAVPRVHDVGRDGDRYYYVMDLLEGRTLRAAVTEDGPLAPPALVRLGYEIARVLAALAAHDVIHRDIKPDNVLVRTDGGVGLVDFGLARHGDDPRLTAEESVVGTIGYLAPEHVLDSVEPSAQTDLYALGMTLAFAATGHERLEGTGGEALAAVARPPGRRTETERADLPPAFADLVRRMTERQPARRPGTAAEVVAALAPLL